MAARQAFVMLLLPSMAFNRFAGCHGTHSIRDVEQRNTRMEIVSPLGLSYNRSGRRALLKVALPPGVLSGIWILHYWCSD